MAAVWEVRLLGALQASCAQHTVVHFGSYKGASLFAYLAYHAGEAVGREVLIEMLWPGCPLAEGRNRLSVALSGLRRILDRPDLPADLLFTTNRQTVRLDTTLLCTDVQRFAAASAAARHADEAQRTAALTTAVASYGGPLLPDYYDAWVLTEHDRLRERYLALVEELLEQLVTAGDLRAASEVAATAASLAPGCAALHERLLQLGLALRDGPLAQRQVAVLSDLASDGLADPPGAAARQAAAALVLTTPVAAAARRITPVIGALTFVAHDGEQAHAAQLAGGRAWAVEGVLAFGSARAAMEFALGLVAAAEPDMVRVGVHAADEPAGPAGAALARDLMAAAGGGQVVVSAAAAALARPHARQRFALHHLGRYRLRGQDEPQEVFQLEADHAAPRGHPPLRLEPAGAGRLPRPLTRFFGRRGELARLTDLVCDPAVRLVILTGAGGCGKTRLATELGHSLHDALNGAVYFVPLHTVREPELVVEAIFDACSIARPPGADLLDLLAQRLRHRPALLILDNFEQVGPGGEQAVLHLLRRCPLLTGLVTSRRRLGLQGEYGLRLRPLAVPAADTDAAALPANESAALFLDRAAAAAAAITVTADNAAALAQVCIALEGSPLALELAAARLPVLPLPALAAQLGERLDWRGRHGARRPARHRSLRACLAWSAELLSDPLRRFFLDLAAFHGSCTAADAAAVCEQPMATDYLAHLRQWSLVEAVEASEGVRYRLLETVRQFALGEQTPGHRQALSARHAAYYAARAEELGGFFGPPEPDLLARFDTELAELSAALEWLTDHRPIEGLAMAVQVMGCCHAEGRATEGGRWLSRALATAPEAPPALRAAARFGFGLIHYWSNLPAALAALTDAVALFGEVGDVAGELLAIQELVRVLGRLDRRQPLPALEQRALALTADAQPGDVRWLARERLRAWFSYYLHRDLHEALGHARRAAEVELSVPAPAWQLVNSLAMCATFALELGDADEIDRWLAPAVPLAEQVGWHALLRSFEWYRAMAAGFRGDLAPAVQGQLDVIAAAWEDGVVWGVAQCLVGLIVLAQEAAQPATVAGLAGLLDQFHERHGLSGHRHHLQERCDAAVALARESLGPATYQAEHERGATADLERFVAAAAERIRAAR